MINKKKTLHNDTKDTDIAFFIPSSRIGGAEIAMLRLANGFSNLGLRVDFLLVNDNGKILDSLSKKIRVVDFNSKKTLFTLIKLINYLVSCHPDVFISAMTHINIITLIAKILSNQRTKIIVSEHSNLSQNIKFSKRIIEKAYPTLIKYFYPKADAIVCVSKGVADDIVQRTKISPEKICVIHNPIPVDEIRISSEEEIFHDWFENSQTPVIISVGRLTIAKDYPTLIEAFSILKRRKDARLLILGEGKERTALQTMINDKSMQKYICLYGNVSNPFKYVKKSSVFVSSSMWEGSPNVLVEALACGISIVATDCHSGPAEILENGKYGKLVPVGNAQEMAVAIAEMLYHPFSPEKLVLRAREFSTEKIIQQYLSLCYKR